MWNVNEIPGSKDKFYIIFTFYCVDFYEMVTVTTAE